MVSYIENILMEMNTCRSTKLKCNLYIGTHRIEYFIEINRNEKKDFYCSVATLLFNELHIYLC